MGLENPLHIVIILAVILMLFGAKRLPEMGRGLGSGLRGFKDGLTNTPEATPEIAAATAAPAATAPSIQTATPAARELVDA